MLEDVKKGGHQPSAPFQPLPRKVNDILVSIAREDPPDARDVSASVYPRLVDLSSEASPPFSPSFLCAALPNDRGKIPGVAIKPEIDPPPAIGLISKATK